jgi:selenocysteine lyase/cysteine desulfurase
MLPSQRALFDVPRDVCYLNAASWSPIPHAVQEAGREGAGRKGRPWLLDASFAQRQHERARAAAARLLNAAPYEIALIPSVSYGVASAAKALTVPHGTRVLVLEDDHASPVLEWLARAEAGGFAVETIRRPIDGDWTTAVLAAIARPQAAPIAVASISSVHWSDGGVIDLGRVASALRAQGAALLVDATQGMGVLPLDVRAIDPDFVVFPTYKWLLGPYGRAFLYVAKRHHEAIPLEQAAHGRRAVRAEQTQYLADTSYLDDARRFDMGERDHIMSLDMAAVGIEMVTAWGADAIAQRLAMLTTTLANGLAGLGVAIPDAALRAPHILCIAFPHGMPARLVETLAAEKIYVAPRVGRLRISPHVYNDEADVERFLGVFRRAVAQPASVPLRSAAG